MQHVAQREREIAAVQQPQGSPPLLPAAAPGRRGGTAQGVPHGSAAPLRDSRTKHPSGDALDLLRFS